METTPETPTPPRKSFFSKPKQLVSGADLRPAEIIPDGVDMNALTDSIVASKATNDAERQKKIEELNKSEYDLAVKCARAEIADKAEKALKKSFHDGVAKRAEEAEARRQANIAAAAKEKQDARQRQVLRELVAFTAQVANATLLIDELATRDIAQVRLLCAALVELDHALSKP